MIHGARSRPSAGLWAAQGLRRNGESCKSRTVRACGGLPAQAQSPRHGDQVATDGGS